MHTYQYQRIVDLLVTTSIYEQDTHTLAHTHTHIHTHTTNTSTQTHARMYERTHAHELHYVSE